MTTATLLDEPADGAIVAQCFGDKMIPEATWTRADHAADEGRYGDQRWFPVEDGSGPLAWDDLRSSVPSWCVLVRLVPERGIAKAFAIIADEYRRCIVAARCTMDATYYATCNGRAEAYRQAVEALARLTGATPPDFEQIRRDVPADGVYRPEVAA